MGKQRFYSVTYTRLINSITHEERILATDVRMSEHDLKSILLDNSRFQYVVIKAELIANKETT